MKKTIKVTKEELSDLYTNQRLTTYQIATKYQIDRSTVCNWLKKFEIPITNIQRKYEKIKEIPLTDLQKQYIFGTLMGDGSIIRSGKQTRGFHLNVGHCEKQLELLEFGKNTLGELIQQKLYKRTDPRNGKIFYKFDTIQHKEFEFFEHLFYDNRIKVVRKEFYDYLTPFSIAIWDMDDGSIDPKRRKSMSLHTECFTVEENQMLSDIIKDKFNISSKVSQTNRKNGKKYYHLTFNKENSIKLTNLIKPYILDSMKYKLIKDEFLNIAPQDLK